VTELDERPAVPPMDTGADERYGFFVAGALLVLIGWGLLTALNVLLHRIAPASGFHVGSWALYPAFGAYAWIAAALGLVTGLLGAVLIQYGRDSPKGRFVLPGEPY
jgi:hypothetical protein